MLQQIRRTFLTNASPFSFHDVVLSAVAQSNVAHGMADGWTPSSPPRRGQHADTLGVQQRTFHSWESVLHSAIAESNVAHGMADGWTTKSNEPLRGDLKMKGSLNFRAMSTSAATASPKSRSEQLHALFESLDEDKDGSLTLAEVQAGASKLGLTKAEATSLFYLLDTDKDNVLLLEEFSVIANVDYMSLEGIRAFLSNNSPFGQARVLPSSGPLGRWGLEGKAEAKFYDHSA